jgi:hypothetical protein
MQAVCEQVGSAKWGIWAGFFCGGDLLSQGIWLVRSAWLKHIIRQTNEDWVRAKYPVMLLSSVVHQGVWRGQQEGEMAKMC